MLEYKSITLADIPALAEMYVGTFNSAPWNEKWTVETASKRLHQRIQVEDFYGLMAFHNNVLCGMILGGVEQFYNGVMFNIKEFCVKNGMRGQGIGTKIFKEFETRIKTLGVTEIVLFSSKGDFTEHFYHNQGLINYNGFTLMGKHL